ACVGALKRGRKVLVDLLRAKPRRRRKHEAKQSLCCLEYSANCAFCVVWKRCKPSLELTQRVGVARGTQDPDCSSPVCLKLAVNCEMNSTLLVQYITYVLLDEYAFHPSQPSIGRPRIAIGHQVTPCKRDDVQHVAEFA